MARVTTKKESKRAVASRVVEAPKARVKNDAPYSLDSLLSALKNNAGLVFLGLSIFIVGFLVGSMWTENSMLKKGYGTSPTALNQQLQQPTQPEAPAVPLTDEMWQKVQENAAGIIGDRNAPQTIVEYTDYQCPFCSRHYLQTYPQIKKDLVDTGKVKIILQDQPLAIHPNARVSALAARCAGDQGFLGAKDKNFEFMHDTLFAKQDEWSNLSSVAAVEKFGEYATEGGMNSNQLMECINTEKFGQMVDDSVALGNSVGANATPTFFVEKTPVVGAQDYSAFQAALTPQQ